MSDQLDVELSPTLEPYRKAIEATIQPYIKIKLTDNNNPTLWQSKFAGLPYMPKDFEYPKSWDGEYLYLLAQINFAEIPQLENLPETGILQFYIALDDLWGLDLNNQIEQDKFRVIYFSNGDLSEQDLITDFSFLPSETDFYLPIDGSCVIEFNIAHAPISAGDYQFYLLDLNNSDDELVDNILEEYYDVFDASGHKLLGYPFFTQTDPRCTLSTEEPYILLLQIDSDSNNNGCDILWGDNGVANFFIKRSDLEKLDFTKVLYNWDCC